MSCTSASSSTSNTSSSSEDELETLTSLLETFTEDYIEEYIGLIEETEQDAPQRKKRKKRKGEKGVIHYTDEEGVRRVLPPTMSLWYNLYIEHPSLDQPRFHKKFRRRFRMPYNSFLELLEIAKTSPLFGRWLPGTKNAAGKPCAPIQLLILCSLRYLGRGWTFDDLSESTAISEEVIRVFFHKFIEFGATTLYERWVVLPTTVEEAQKQSHEFEVAGMPGAIGSMDATHVVVDRVKYRLRQAHLGFKLNCTARTYNLICNHRRRILSTTEGHPARWNDKTLVKFDRFVMNLKNGAVLQDFTFQLYDRDGDGNIIRKSYRGPWLLVDNGYHQWSVTIPPFKRTTSRKEIRFSEWLESMRKDVECTFGILKGRWRILKTGIRIHGIAEADNVWKTCCALHNMLLEVDGLDEKWNDGVGSEWEGEAGLHESDDIGRIRAITRLNNPSAARAFDCSGMGEGDDRIEEEDTAEEDTAGEDTAGDATEEQAMKTVCQVSFEHFRTKLVNHFDIAFQRRELQWPKRNGSVMSD